MVGFYSGAPVDSLAEQAEGLDLVPTSPGRVNAAAFGGAMASNITPRLMRQDMLGAFGGTPEMPDYDAMGNITGGVVPEQQGSPTLPAEEATAKYGGDGLKFDHPVTEEMAQALHASHHDEQLRADIIARSDGSLLASAPARFAVSLGAGLLDPLNVAAAFIPVVGEARAAGMIAAASGALGRAGVRAGIGAAEGAVGMAALEPLNYALDRAEGNDWTMGQAIQNIAMGAVLGSVLHVGGGLIKDTATGRTYSRDTARGELLERIDALDPEAREGALRGSVAAVAEGRPVEVAPLLDLAEARSAEVELARWHAQQQRLVAEAEAAADAARVSGAPDRAASIAEAEGRLSRLRSDATGFRDEIAGVRARAVQSAMDPESQARLGEIRAELAQPIPAARRADLEHEQTMLTEGRGDIDVRSSSDLDTARATSEAAGLQTGLQRTEAAAAEAEAALQAVRQRAAQEEAEAAARRGSADRSLRIQQAKIDAREQITQNLTERTVRRYAAQVGTALERGEIARIAREIRTAQPAEAADIIAHALNDIAERSGRPEIQAAVEAGVPVGRSLREEANDAATQLHSNAATPPADPDTLAATRLNTAVAERAPKAEGPPDAQTAELQRLYEDARKMVDAEVKAGRLTEGDAAVLAAADERAAILEGDAKAYEAAAACLATRA